MSLKRDYLLHTIPKNDAQGWQDLTDFSESQNIDVVKAMVSGRDPLTNTLFSGLRALGLDVPGDVYVLVSGSMDIRDGYLPIYSRQNRLESPLYSDEFWSPRQQNDWNGLAKWSWHINSTKKLSFSTSRQVAISQGFSLPGEGFPRPWIDSLDDFLVFTNESILSSVYWRHVLSETDWYEITLGRNWSRQHSNVNGNDDFRTYGPHRLLLHAPFR